MAVYTQIDNSELYFQCKLYTGNGSDDKAVTFDNTDTNMSPNIVWIKSRTQSGYNHYLVDTLRGVTKALRPNLYNDEDTYSDAFKSFDSNGFTLDDDTSNSEINQNTKTYVAWCWKAGGSASSNTNGSTTSSVSANTTVGFSIATYPGNGSSGATIGHGLSTTAPKIVLIKKRSAADSWTMLNTNIDLNKYLKLNGTDAEVSDPMFNNTAPTTSVFTVDSDGQVNENSNTFVAYCFSEVQGFSKFGKYTGNGNADGTFVYTGFRPAWLLLKKSSASGNTWQIFDNKRDTGNALDNTLEADTNSAEATGTDRLDFLSNGFKIRTSGSAQNASGATFIYMAFAEAPFVNSNGVPNNAR